MITPDALYEMAHAIKKKNDENKPILVYSDEDKCDSSGARFYDPHLKLDFNLDLILTFYGGGNGNAQEIGHPQRV